MTKIRCDNQNCIWNDNHYCCCNEVEFVAVYPDRLERVSKCKSYEKRTDYVEFFEQRGFG